MPRFDDPAECIRYLAEARGKKQKTNGKMTYAALARAAGVQWSTLWRIVNGHTAGSPLVRQRLTELARERLRKIRRARKCSAP